MEDIKNELNGMLIEKELYRFIYHFCDNPIIMTYNIEYDNQTIRIPIDGSNHRIIYENNKEETELKYTYKNKGEYKITIYGDNITYIDYSCLAFFECFYLTELNSYGSAKLNKVSFKRCINLTKVPDMLLDTIEDISEMFSHTKKFNQDISNWDIKNIKNMSYMFHNAISFIQDISGWNIINNINKIDNINNINTNNMFLGAVINDKNKPLIK